MWLNHKVIKGIYGDEGDYSQLFLLQGSGAVKLRTHVTGRIVHGRSKYFFTDYNQFPHDSNLVLSCLLRILQQEAHQRQLPPTLFIQLDNTCRY